MSKITDLHPLDIQDSLSLRYPICSVCHPECTLGLTTVLVIPGCPDPHRWYVSFLCHHSMNAHSFKIGYTGMTMTFFLNVTDTGERSRCKLVVDRILFPNLKKHLGSWLEIGQSISFFCITSLLLVWSAGICATGEYLMADTLVQLWPIKRD